MLRQPAASYLTVKPTDFFTVYVLTSLRTGALRSDHARFRCLKHKKVFLFIYKMCMRPSFLLFSNSHYAIRLVFDRKYPKSWTIQDRTLVILKVEQVLFGNF